MYDSKIGTTVTWGLESTVGLEITRNNAPHGSNHGHVHRQFDNNRSIIGKKIKNASLFLEKYTRSKNQAVGFGPKPKLIGSNLVII